MYGRCDETAQHSGHGTNAAVSFEALDQRRARCDRNLEVHLLCTCGDFVPRVHVPHLLVKVRGHNVFGERDCIRDGIHQRAHARLRELDHLGW